MDKLNNLNKIDILYIKSILKNRQKQNQKQIEELKKQQTTSTTARIITLQSEQVQIIDILNKLN